MGDSGELWNAVKQDRRERRKRLGVACPMCAIARPKAPASILLPQQRCKVDGYVDPRPRSKDPSSAE